MKKVSVHVLTTGLDIGYGAQPFIVTVCTGNGQKVAWVWDVNPITRTPIVPAEDLVVIQEVFNEADLIVMQNAVWQILALQTVFCGALQVDWRKIADTMLAGHILGSNQPHDLVSMTAVFLGRHLKGIQDRIERETKQARAWVRQSIPDWRISRASTRETPEPLKHPWKSDIWLLNALHTISSDDSPAPDNWAHLAVQYAHTLCECVILLYDKQRQQLRRRDLMHEYNERREAFPVLYALQSDPVSIRHQALDDLLRRTESQQEFYADRMHEIAAKLGQTIKLPQGQSNQSLLNFVFDKAGLGVEPIALTKQGKPSLATYAVELMLEAEGHSDTMAQHFFIALRLYRQAKKLLAYYRLLANRCRQIFQVGSVDGFTNLTATGMLKVWPSINQTGTDTTRWKTCWPHSEYLELDFLGSEGTNIRNCIAAKPFYEFWTFQILDLTKAVEQKWAEVMKEQLIEARKQNNVYTLGAIPLRYGRTRRARMPEGEERRLFMEGSIGYLMERMAVAVHKYLADKPRVSVRFVNEGEIVLTGVRGKIATLEHNVRGIMREIGTPFGLNLGCLSENQGPCLGDDYRD